MAYVPLVIHGSNQVSSATAISYLRLELTSNSIGNAKVAGMATDLDLDSGRYSITLVVFFVGYVVFEVPYK